jgi:hypothetical protein
MVYAQVTLIPTEWLRCQYIKTSICLTIPPWSFFLSGTVKKNRTSYKIEHYHILCFLLLRDLTVVVLVSWLGVEDKNTGTLLFHTINSQCLVQTVYLPINSKTAQEMGQEIRGTFLAGHVTSWKNWWVRLSVTEVRIHWYLTLNGV